MKERKSHWYCFIFKASLGGQSVKYANRHKKCKMYSPMDGLDRNKYLNPYKGFCRTCKFCAMEGSTTEKIYSETHPNWICGVIEGSTIPEDVIITPEKINRNRFANIDIV